MEHNNFDKLYCIKISLDDIVTNSGMNLSVNLVGSLLGGMLLSSLAIIVIDNILFIGNSIIRKIGENSIYVYVLHFIGLYIIELSNAMWSLIIGCLVTIGLPAIYIAVFKKKEINKVLF